MDMLRRRFPSVQEIRRMLTLALDALTFLEIAEGASVFRVNLMPAWGGNRRKTWESAMPAIFPLSRPSYKG